MRLRKDEIVSSFARIAEGEADENGVEEAAPATPGEETEKK
jgi:hypothetical protein